MPLELDEYTATLAGAVVVDEVELFVAWLRATPKGQVDLRNCTHMHTGILQAILVFGPKISIPPSDAFLAQWVLPLIAADRFA